MKLLVFAHTPPPHHGQSYMVQLMLDGLGGDQRKQRNSAPPRPGSEFGIECYHVNARFSKKLEDIGDFRPWKFVLLLYYCAQAIWCRFRYGIENFYYVPAPGKTSALYRDWVVMLLCRPFFKRLILHWHAAGLAKWLETVKQLRFRSITYGLMKQPDLSMVICSHNVADPQKLWSKRIKVIANGIPDPCLDFEQAVLPRRLARTAFRRKLLAGDPVEDTKPDQVGAAPHIFEVLYLAHCTREKGLFDALEGVALANATLARRNSPLRLHLTVAGEFISPAEQQEFEERIARPDLQLPETHRPPLRGAPGTSREGVTYAGFVYGAEKHRLLAESDCFCFPTFYSAESFALVVVEAMAFGLPVVTTRWRSVPELLPLGYPGLVNIRSPQEVADALQRLMTTESAQALREGFLHKYVVEQFLVHLAKALHESEEEKLVPTQPGVCPVVTA